MTPQLQYINAPRLGALADVAAPLPPLGYMDGLSQWKAPAQVWQLAKNADLKVLTAQPMYLAGLVTPPLAALLLLLQIIGSSRGRS